MIHRWPEGELSDDGTLTRRLDPTNEGAARPPFVALTCKEVSELDAVLEIKIAPNDDNHANVMPRAEGVL
jgi:hypothetical protein